MVVVKRERQRVHKNGTRLGHVTSSTEWREGHAWGKKHDMHAGCPGGMRECAIGAATTQQSQAAAAAMPLSRKKARNGARVVVGRQAGMQCCGKVSRPRRWRGQVAGVQARRRPASAAIPAPSFRHRRAHATKPVHHRPSAAVTFAAALLCARRGTVVCTKYNETEGWSSAMSIMRPPLKRRREVTSRHGRQVQPQYCCRVTMFVELLFCPHGK